MALPAGDLDRKYLLTPKLLYYCLASIYYAIQYFRVRFCKVHFGLSVSEAGYVATAMALTGCLSAPMVGVIADRTGRHRTILMLLCALAAASLELLLINMPTASLKLGYIVAVFAAYGAFLGGILPLTDYQTLKLLREKFGASSTLYGRQRMMGTVAFSVNSWLVGILVDRFGYGILFYAAPILSALSIIVLLLFGYPDEAGSRNAAATIEAPKASSRPDQSSPSSQALAAEPKASVWVFFTSFHFVFFLFSVLITGCGRQVIQLYLESLIKDNLGLGASVTGASVIWSSILSITCLFFGAEIIALLGVRPMLLLGMVSMGVRVGLYIFVRPSPWAEWIVYSIEVLNGISFGFTHLASVRFASQFAPRGLEATAQSIYLSFYMALPALLCAFLGSRIYEQLGGTELFRLTSLLILGASAIVGAKFALENSLCRRSSPQHPGGE